MPKLISILIPVFNEQNNVFKITEAIHAAFSNAVYDYEILFVNDGSSDGSLGAIKHISDSDHHVKFISFSRNFGKDNALLAGIQHATGDAVITIDADMQHPPALIPQLIESWEQGNEVVYTYRESKNEHATGFNRASSTFFYKIVNRLSDVELEDGIADYRLIDRKVVDVLKGLHEDFPFFRGLIKWVGFQQKAIPYIPQARESGESKYNTKALIRLAMHGITSFSTKPLTIAIYLGFTFSAISLLYIPYVIISLYFARPISGWSSLIVTVAFFGGVQLMILGIVGIYLGKLFMQSKQRPQFIIQEKKLS